MDAFRRGCWGGGATQRIARARSAVTLEPIITQRQPIRRDEQVARHRGDGHPHRLSRLQQRGGAATVGRFDRLGEHSMTDGPLSADTEPDQRAAEEEDLEARRRARDERAERVQQHRGREDVALAEAIRERARDDPADARRAEGHAEHPRFARLGEVKRVSDRLFEEADQDQVVEVERPAEECEGKQPGRERAGHDGMVVASVHARNVDAMRHRRAHSLAGRRSVARVPNSAGND